MHENTKTRKHENTKNMPTPTPQMHFALLINKTSPITFRITGPMSLRVLQSSCLRLGRVSRPIKPATSMFFRASSSSDSKKVPDSTYDEKSESDKELLELATVLSKHGDLRHLAGLKDALSWNDIEEASNQPSKVLKEKDIKAFIEERGAAVVDESLENDSDLTLTPAEEALLASSMNEDVGEYVESFNPMPSYLPNQMLNYNLPWRSSADLPDPVMNNFLRNSDPEKYRFDKQGHRSCPGKLQRKGKAGTLGCMKIDLNNLHHFDVLTLRNYLSQDAEILSRRQSGLCAKCQRRVAKTIKRARQFGILPHIGQYEIQRVVGVTDETFSSESDDVSDGKRVFISKVVFSK